MRGLLIAGALVMIYVLDFARGDVMEKSYVNLYYYPGVAFCCAVILFATIGVTLDLKSRLVRVVVYLGKISYGLYVWHYGCFYVAGVLYHLLPKSPHFVIGFVARGGFALGLAVALASLSYRFLEQPFLRFKKKFARTPATAATLPAP
jgi:peptidoglycan/LPS O-acetylase OafA/YrhL